MAAHKVYRSAKDARGLIATLAVGGDHLLRWEQYALPLWDQYCARHNLGLVAVTERISAIGSGPTHIMWQKFLIPEYIRNAFDYMQNMLYVDTDILINPQAPNVFDEFDSRGIGLVSQVSKLPYPHQEVLRRIAFFRHTFMSKDYPLDSSLFMKPRDIFRSHNLDLLSDDFACAGLFVINCGISADRFASIYSMYSHDQATLDGGSDEVHLNYEVQKGWPIQWLDYRFHALWIYEMAWKYPFLYRPECIKDKSLVAECIVASLYSNYLLHFAGSWEGDMWMNEAIVKSVSAHSSYRHLYEYMQQPVTGQPVGVIRPSP